MTTRTERQAQIDTRVAQLRARAEKMQTEADRLHGTVETDYAFWTQPAYGNAAGRAFANRRDRERSKLIKAGEIAAEAKELREKADRMERRGAVMAGDTEAARQKIVEATTVFVGQMVDTTFYGVRKVLKVNAKSILVEGAFGAVKVEKQYVRAA